MRYIFLAPVALGLTLAACGGTQDAAVMNGADNDMMANTSMDTMGTVPNAGMPMDTTNGAGSMGGTDGTMSTGGMGTTGSTGETGSGGAAQSTDAPTATTGSSTSTSGSTSGSTGTTGGTGQ